MLGPPSSRPPGGRGRLFQTLLPGLVGAAIGYAVGVYEDVQALSSIMLPLYALMGAIAGILAYRVSILVREMINDFRQGD